MSFIASGDVSLRLMSIVAQIIGFWPVGNRLEQCIRNTTLVYTLITMLFGIWLQTRDIYYSWGDFSACLFAACNFFSVAMPLFKILVLLSHKEDFFRLILHIQTEFLSVVYDGHERKILGACKRQCTFFVCFLTFSTNATLVSYVVNPLVVNIGRNETDRVLPFNMWINLPVRTTPYYEIIFVMQVLALYHIGTSYFCFDNFLCIMNLHAACQFRILQHRMANIADLNDPKDGKVTSSSPGYVNKYCDAFKKHIRLHQALINYCQKLEEVFNLIVLAQVLTFSVLICLDGYQVLMPEAPTTRRIIFSFHLSVCMCQLLMFTYSCDCMLRESIKIVEAAYSGPWILLPVTSGGKMIRKDLIFVMMRASVPCCLTAGGFFVTSLETYTRVLSTAVSYFTLLQRSSETNDL